MVLAGGLFESVKHRHGQSLDYRPAAALISEPRHPAPVGETKPDRFSLQDQWKADRLPQRAFAGKSAQTGGISGHAGLKAEDSRAGRGGGTGTIPCTTWASAFWLRVYADRRSG